MLSAKTISKFALVGTLVAGVALAGCAAANGSSATEVTDASSTTNTTSNTDSTSTVSIEWTNATKAEDAVKGANLTGEFSVPDKLTACSIEFDKPEFSYTNGIVQATYNQAASAVQIRKGVGPAGTVTPDDGIGMHGESFAQSWEITPGGLPITCYGNVKGEVIFAQWYNKVDPTAAGDEDAYSIYAMGLGGEDIPMTEAEVGEIALNVK